MSVTHILWREDGPEFVDLEQGGIDPENPDLEPLPDGLDTDFITFDPVARTIAPDPVKAGAEALRRVDERQERAFGTVSRLALADLTLWAELQDLKRFTDAQVSGMSAAQRNSNWPFFIALLTEHGTPLAEFRAAATKVEGEIAPRIVKLAKLSAKALLARRAVAVAQTAEEKLAAADVDWEG